MRCHRHLSRRLCGPVAALLVVVLLSQGASAAALQNGGFESGTLNGWTSHPAPGGSIASVPRYDVSQRGFPYDPIEGQQFALLKSGNGGSTGALAQTLDAQAGQTISCWNFFDPGDASSANDSADVRILSGNNSPANVFHADVASPDQPGYMDWTTWQYTVTVSGAYVIEARIISAGDKNWPSALGLDGCAVGRRTTITSLKANRTGDRIIITWQTSSEMNNIGFNLYRATAADGPYDAINADIILAKGTAHSGASYSYEDRPGAGNFFYKLEDIDMSWNATLHGPAAVQSTSPFRRPPRQPVPPRS